MTNVSSFSTKPHGKPVLNTWTDGGRMGVRLGTSYLDAPDEEVKILTFQALTVPTDPDYSTSKGMEESDGLNQSKFISEMAKELEVLDTLESPSTSRAKMSPQSLELPVSSTASSDGEVLASQPDMKIMEVSITNEVTIMEDKETPQDRLAKLAQRANEVVAKYDAECQEIRKNFIPAKKESLASDKIMTPFVLLGMTITTAMVITAPDSSIQMDLSVLQDPSLSEVWNQAKHKLESDMVSIPSLIGVVSNPVRESLTTFSHTISTTIQGTVDQVQKVFVNANPIDTLDFPAPQDIQHYLNKGLENIVEPIKAAQVLVSKEIASLQSPAINFNIIASEIQAFQDETASKLMEAADIVTNKLESIQMPQIDVDYVMEQVNAFQKAFLTLTNDQKDILVQKVSSLVLPTIDVSSISDRLEMIKATLNTQEHEVQHLFRFQIPKIDAEHIQGQFQSVKANLLNFSPDTGLTQFDLSMPQDSEPIKTSSLELVNLMDDTSSVNLLDKSPSDSITNVLPRTSSISGFVKIPEYIF
jgi:hypothetical protein